MGKERRHVLVLFFFKKKPTKLNGKEVNSSEGVI